MFMELLELNKIEAKILYWKMLHRKLIDLKSYIHIYRIFEISSTSNKVYF